MRKFIVSAVLVLAWVTAVFAADLYAPEGKTVTVGFAPERGALTYLNAVTDTGDGSAVDIGFRAKHQACTITIGGTAPTSVNVTMKRSTDGGTNYATVLTHTYTVATVDTQGFDVSYLGRYWKASFDSKVGGDATTAVTLKCDAKE